ncbi:MAG: dTDP-4-dehydrorhamnose 3,5-epimerase [Nitrospina sp.]|nr:dTDP-4-dehydrorhamnose 3,5-epimerase [Nitrospina sp.]
MKVFKTKLQDVLLIEPKVFRDPRGFFLETYNSRRYHGQGIDVPMVQDNRAFSSKGVLRGLHFQKNFPQDKLVWAPHGEVMDIALDLRKSSPTYGQWEAYHLTGENHLQAFIPVGFAHGYVVLSDTAEFAYKCSEFYHPEDEGGVVWNDPDLAIDWGIADPIISEKDAKLPRMRDLDFSF